MGSIKDQYEKMLKLHGLAALKALEALPYVRPFCREHGLELTFKAGWISMTLASQKFETAFTMSWCHIMENSDENCKDIEITLVKKVTNLLPTLHEWSRWAFVPPSRDL